MSSSKTAPDLPKNIDRYQVRALLGGGTFGTVYRAFDPRLDREIALKVLRPEMTTSIQAVERFLREAKAAAKLFHPHIVPVYDAGRAGTEFYIASAFIQGKTLAAAIPKGGMEAHRAAELAAQLALALAYAHRQGVLHRDVKPANIMVDEQGALYLMDFGLAAWLQEEGTRLTQDGAMMGTPAYMAPEQACGDNANVGPAADLYSAGVVLYELLTGRRPFEGHPAALVYQIINKAAAPPSQYRPDLDPLLDAICLKALAKDPAQRYRKGEDMAKALRGLPPPAMLSTETEATFATQHSDTLAAAGPRPHVRTPKHERTHSDSSSHATPGHSATPADRVHPRGGSRLPWMLSALAAVAVLAILAGGAVVFSLLPSAGQTPKDPSIAHNDQPPTAVTPPRTEPTPPSETTGSGKLVDVVGDRLTFTADGEERTVTVPAGAAVQIDGKDGALDEIQKDSDVVVTSRGDIVCKIVAKYAPPPPAKVTVAGQLLSADQDKLTATVDGKRMAFTVPATAKVTIDGKDGKLTDIKKDSTLTVIALADVASKVEAKSPAAPTPKTTTASGSVIGVDNDKLTVNVGLKKPRTFTIPDTAKVMIDATKGNLADIKKESIVTVTSTDDIVVAVEVKSAPPQERTTAGKVTKVEKNKITINDAAGKELVRCTVPTDARVTIDGKAAKIDDIKAESTVTVTLTGDIAWKVDAISPAPRPPKLLTAVGRVVGVDKDKLTVRADEGEKTFTVPAAATVRIDDKDGQLADILKNSTVSITTKDDVIVTVETKSPSRPAPAKAPFSAAEAKRVQEAWADYLGVPVEREVKLSGSVTMKLKLIPPGRFTMGSPKNEEGRHDDEAQHDVEISQAFYIGVSPVTKAQFAAFVDSEPYKTEAETDGQGGYGYNAATRKLEGRDPKYNWKNTGREQTDAHPVVNMTWTDAQKFCAWLSKKDWKTYELPSEGEWEYACRAGTTTRFWCGDADASLKGNANIADASLKEKYPNASWALPWDDGYPFTSPVGKFNANPWGLYDMHGNVWQWCNDGYGKYQEGYIKDPKGDDNSERRVLRGGSCYSDPRPCRSAYRGLNDPTIRHNCDGFRVVLRFPARTP